MSQRQQACAQKLAARPCPRWVGGCWGSGSVIHGLSVQFPQEGWEGTSLRACCAALRRLEEAWLALEAVVCGRHMGMQGCCAAVPWVVGCVCGRVSAIPGPDVQPCPGASEGGTDPSTGLGARTGCGSFGCFAAGDLCCAHACDKAGVPAHAISRRSPESLTKRTLSLYILLEASGCTSSWDQRISPMHLLMAHGLDSCLMWPDVPACFKCSRPTGSPIRRSSRGRQAHQM